MEIEQFYLFNGFFDTLGDHVFKMATRSWNFLIFDLKILKSGTYLKIDMHAVWKYT